MPTRPRVLVLSEILPAPGNAGGLILSRHLRDYPEVLALAPPGAPPAQCATVRAEPGILWRYAQAHPRSRLVHLLALAGWIQPFRYAAARRAVASHRPEILLAVAHGEPPFLAARLARRARLPLVLFFHDWWPDFVPTRHRERLDLRYRRLYRRSAAALCVSEEFREMLGPHPRAVVLPPLPRECPAAPPTSAAGAAFQVHYHGNMTGCYHLPLAAILRLLPARGWELRLAGSAADWTPTEVTLARERAGYQGYLPEDDLDRLRTRASAFLVVLSFFDGDRRRVRTSFPTKLVEYCQARRPIVVWGPADSAAARWARKTGAALTVEDPDPVQLARTIEALAADGDRQAGLAAAAGRQADTVFSPARIRQVFDDLLDELTGRRSAVP